MKITREHVIWGYRLFLGREPESDLVVEQKLAAVRSVEELRRAFVMSGEFRSAVDVVATVDVSNIVIKEIDDSLRLFVDLADTHVGLNVVLGAYEPDERAFIVSHLRAGDVALDVGANIGFFSILMAAQVGPAGHVYSFEPLNRNAALLERSVAENRFQTRVTVTRAAVAEAQGTLELISPRVTNNWGGAYLRTDSSEVPADHELLSVPIVTLDTCALRRPVRLIKLDAEGAEMRVLRGAKAILQQDRPVILVELNQQQLASVSRCSASDVINEMVRLGYRCFTLGSGGQLGNEITGYDGVAIINAVFLPQ